MQRTKAPFRADEVGSLLRPARVKEARARLAKGEISADDLRKAEDIEIEKVVHRQASAGLKLATDGELRRSWWHFDFLSHLVGCELFHPDEGIQFAGVQTRHEAIRVIGKLDFPADHPMLAHFKFLKRQCDIAHVTAKMTIPSPTVLHFRGGRKLISNKVYPDLEEFYLDLGKTYTARRSRRSTTPAAAICNSTTPCGPISARRKKCRSRALAATIPTACRRSTPASSITRSLSGPADMVITTHVCRGNFARPGFLPAAMSRSPRSCWGATNYDGYFLEYDSDRAGGFEPLRYLPAGNKIVVAGIITSKTGALEKKDDIKRRLEEAAKFVPLDQLALSPQCGFASTEEGNILTEEEQWAKLRLAVEVAEDVWGK